MNNILYPWQRPSAETLAALLRRQNFALDASEPGIGKTFIALAAAAQAGLTDPLIIAPLSVHTAWTEAAALFKLIPKDIINLEKIRYGNTRWATQVDKRKKSWRWNLPPGSLLIWDEIHNAGGEKTQNSRLLAYTKADRIKVLGLSATLAETPQRLNAAGFLMGMHHYHDFKKWCLNNGCIPNRFHPTRLEFYPESPRAREAMQRLNTQIFPAYGCRLRTADIEDFPETMIQADEYNLENLEDVQRIYAELREELKAQPDDLPITKLLRARQRIELLKMPLWTSLTEEMLEAGCSVVIFVNFRETAHELHEQLLAHKPALIIGDQQDRDTQVKRFFTNETRVCVATVQAGGVSISLHDVTGTAPRRSLISPPLSVVHLKQTLGRIHRAGGKSKSINKLVFAAGTEEEKIYRRVRAKLNNLSLLNDGDLMEDFYHGPDNS